MDNEDESKTSSVTTELIKSSRYTFQAEGKANFHLVFSERSRGMEISLVGGCPSSSRHGQCPFARVVGMLRV